MDGQRLTLNEAQNNQWADDLATMGYPGYTHRLWQLSQRTPPDPTSFMITLLNERAVSARVVNGFPWVLFHFALAIDWEALVKYAVEHDRQNRLGFLVTLAAEYAEKNGERERAARLNHYQEVLNRVRLDQDDTFFDEHVSMFQSESGRQWLELYRPEEARYWRLDTNTELKSVENHMK